MILGVYDTWQCCSNRLKRKNSSWQYIVLVKLDILVWKSKFGIFTKTIYKNQLKVSQRPKHGLTTIELMELAVTSLRTSKGGGDRKLHEHFKCLNIKILFSKESKLFASCISENGLISVICRKWITYKSSIQKYVKKIEKYH